MFIYIFTKLFSGGNDMAAIYVALIIHGRRTFEQVPDKFKDAVREDLLALGLNENDEAIVG